MPQKYEQVLYVERLGNNVAQVVLNRPEALNALSTQLVSVFIEELTALADDDAIDIVIITGAGGRAFSAGLDLKEVNEATPEEIADAQKLFASMWETLLDFPKVLIAAVDGYAAGAGFQIVLNCDFVLVSDVSRLGMAEINAGLVPINGSWLLESIIGRIRTAAVVLNGEWITGKEALDWGVANRLTPAGDVVDAARLLAVELSKKPRFALAQTCGVLRDIRRGGGMTYERTHSLGAEIFSRLATKNERTERVSAFVEKRS